MPENKDVVRRYIDGFNRSDREPGVHRQPEDHHHPDGRGDDVVMAEMTLEVQRATGETLRAVMGEVFVFRWGKIEERRANVIELKENDYK